MSPHQGNLTSCAHVHVRRDLRALRVLQAHSLSTVANCHEEPSLAVSVHCIGVLWDSVGNLLKVI
eukprot:m.150534 g.150534  ORF g.150534 m.150534 type:complete len:65 (-) comp11683_c1_seq2:42-236(-)